MKIRNLGLPSSSILGKESVGGGLWNWRVCIPFFPLALTTSNMWPWPCFFGDVCAVDFLVEKSVCLSNPPPSSCSNIVLDDGSLTRAFRDMPTSIFHFASILALLSSQNQQVKSLLCFQFCRGKSYPRKHEHAPHPRDTHTDDEEPMSALHVAEVWPLFSTWWS